MSKYFYFEFDAENAETSVDEHGNERKYMVLDAVYQAIDEPSLTAETLFSSILLRSTISARIPRPVFSAVTESFLIFLLWALRMTPAVCFLKKSDYAAF